jgi:signal transduction histidine kinase
MSRWKLFPNKTSKKITFILTFGMLIIYCGSMFVYAIYDYPKKPDNIQFQNDFVRVVTLSQSLKKPLDLKQINLLNGLGMLTCVYSKGDNKDVPRSYRCGRDTQLNELKTINSFTESGLRNLQEAHKNHYHFKVLLGSDRPSDESKVKDYINTALLIHGAKPQWLRQHADWLSTPGFRVTLISQLKNNQLIKNFSESSLRQAIQSSPSKAPLAIKISNHLFAVMQPVNYADKWLIITSVPGYKHNIVEQLGFVFVFFSFLIAIVFLCLWAMRSVSMPVSKFLVAAKRFGRDLQAPPMAIEGSKEMRDVIQEYNNMQAKIRRLVLDRTQMLAAISHDLRTPITRLLMRIEYLQGSDQYEKAAKDLQEMDSMIRSILSFARDYTSTEAMERFDIGALVDTICIDLQETKMDVEYRSVDFKQEFFGRVNALRRAISNIIENAVKYGDKALVVINVKKNELLIKVTDYGPGIPEVEMDKVFAPFYRVDPARNPEKSGSGLGLAVARDVIRSHAGDIKLKNSDQPEQGLVVTIVLPLSD